MMSYPERLGFILVEAVETRWQPSFLMPVCLRLCLKCFRRFQVDLLSCGLKPPGFCDSDSALLLFCSADLHSASQRWRRGAEVRDRARTRTRTHTQVRQQQPLQGEEQDEHDPTGGGKGGGGESFCKCLVNNFSSQ